MFPLAPGGNYYTSQPTHEEPPRDVFRNGMANGDSIPPVPKEPLVVEQPVARKRKRQNIHLDDVVEYLPNPQRVCAVLSTVVLWRSYFLHQSVTCAEIHLEERQQRAARFAGLSKV